MVPPVTAAGPSVGSPVIPSSGPLVAGPFPIPDSSGRPGPGPVSVPPTMISEHRPGGAVRPGPGPSPAAGGSAPTCPRCGTLAQAGFAYCQQCGLHLQGIQPTDPGANARARPSPAGRPPTAGGQPPIDPQAATLAADGVRAGPGPGPGSLASPAAAPRPQAGPAWGTAILVNRDGSDGQRYTLSGEYLVIGRAGADIAFDDDRFLGRQHARLERAPDGAVKVVPIDTLNGVFRKADAPVELADGMVILVGREVLRYEAMEPEEMKVHPLVRHGVALFGSPPREPWGRLVQIIPNGGYRDVRHLAAEEIVLGREEGDVVFRDDAFMSRRHAAVTWDGRKAQITDLGSSNGTFVRITGPTPLRHGDHVRMGDQLLRIELGR
jgi:pSer/pThr/pTyr-binding forkhead associated (FHA) protein